MDALSKDTRAVRAASGKPFSSRASAWSTHGAWVFPLLLVVVTTFAYLPALKNGFIWDDDAHLTKNPCIVGPLGLKDIWTSRAARICPLVQTTFWVEHRLWGLAPFPYHLVNVLVHGAAAAVLWAVLRSLRVRGAWLGATLWALHPVQVETAGWITELKNTQSCLFYLLAIFFFVRSLTPHPKDSATRKRILYSLSLFCGAAAMASKSATVILPFVLCLAVWWLDRAWPWRRAVKIVPFFFFSVAAAILSVWTQGLEGANETEFALKIPERLVIAGKVIWFYLGKLIWPHPLIFIYPRSQIDPHRMIDWFPLAAVGVVLFVLWWCRQGRLRPAFFAFAYFIIALLPVLGLLQHYFLRYSFVGDHFQYLASIGPLALAGAGITSAFTFLTPGERIAQPVFCTALCVLLGTLTWRQCATFVGNETLWRATLTGNPRCWIAENNLGGLLGQTNRLDEAVVHLREALAIRPNFADAENNLARTLAQMGRGDEAVAHYKRALELKPNFHAFDFNLGSLLLEMKRPNEALPYLEVAIQGDPKDVNAQNNLGNALLELGRTDDAIIHYQMAVQLRANDSATDRASASFNLANALLREGRTGEAIARYEEAIRLQPSFTGARQNLAYALHLQEQGSR